MTMTTPQDGQVLYCKQEWCVDSGRLNQADCAIRTEGSDFSLSCATCVHEWELAYPAARLIDIGAYSAGGAVPNITGLPDRIVLVPLTEKLAGEVRAVLAESAALAAPEPVAPVLVTAPAAYVRKPVSKTAKTGWAALARIILGIIFFIAGAEANTPGAEGTPGAPLIITGVLLVALPLLIGAVFTVMLLGREISRDIAKERAWKATLTPEQRLGVQAAETAALFAAWAGVHHWVKESDAKSAAAYQERSAASQARSAQYQQQAQQAQMAADLHTIAAAQQGAAPRYDPNRIVNRLNYGPAVIKNFPGHPAPGHQGSGARNARPDEKRS
jgi:hypothetical protein